MENTSPKKFRANLKDYLNLAKKEKVRIKKRSGQNFILMSEEKYEELKTELTTLQKRLLANGHSSSETHSKVKKKMKEIKANQKKQTKSTTKKVAKKAVKKATKKIVA